MKIISGNSNPLLADKVSKILDIPLTQAAVKSFADHEISVEFHESIRGEDVYLIQSTSCPANDHLMELLIMIDAAKRGSAKRITAVIPYFGYARQDRKTGPRTPISAKLVADLLTTAGTHRVLTCDLHTGQIQGFFDIPLDNMFTAPLFSQDIKQNFEPGSFVIVSPDVGGVVRARAVAKRVNADLAIIDKRREQAGISEVMNIIGDVKGRTCILIDDIIDSAGTLSNAATALVNAGATSVSAYASHGVFSGSAFKTIQNSVLEKVSVTDSIHSKTENLETSKIKYLTISTLLAEAMNRISLEKSVSCLFD